MVKVFLKIYYDYGCDDFKAIAQKDKYFTFCFHYKNYDLVETEISSN